MDIGMRITGGSMSVRTSYPTMRRVGALARHLLLQAAANQWQVPLDSLTTEPGRWCMRPAAARSAMANCAQALDLPNPPLETIKLKDDKQFRWIGKPLARLDVLDKSTGRAQYSIDTQSRTCCRPPYSTPAPRAGGRQHPQ
jgi:isoquinoline 1-oxidoreductase beta subunit